MVWVVECGVSGSDASLHKGDSGLVVSRRARLPIEGFRGTGGGCADSRGAVFDRRIFMSRSAASLWCLVASSIDFCTISGDIIAGDVALRRGATTGARVGVGASSLRGRSLLVVPLLSAKDGGGGFSNFSNITLYLSISVLGITTFKCGCGRGGAPDSALGERVQYMSGILISV